MYGDARGTAADRDDANALGVLVWADPGTPLEWVAAYAGYAAGL